MQRVLTWFLLACLLVTGGAVHAQTTDAMVTGRVLDVANKAVPGADIVVSNIENGVRYAGKTDRDGLYVVPDIHPGIYRIEVSKPGYRTLLKPDVVLHVESVIALNFVLSFGSTAESITLPGGASPTSTYAGSIGTVVDGRQITELPLNGRNFTQLALLTPGTTRGAYGDIASGVNNAAETHRYSESGGAALSVSGMRPQANNFLLDGIDNNESLVNTITFFPPAEAIQEFRVSTSVAPAEFGRSGGAIVQTSIRSGTNTLHGSIFEFLRNSALDANNAYFATPDPLTGRVPSSRSIETSLAEPLAWLQSRTGCSCLPIIRGSVRSVTGSRNL